MKRSYQIYVSSAAWGAFPKYMRPKILSKLPVDLIIKQPEAKLRYRRCINLELHVVAKLEVIAIVNKLHNPWSGAIGTSLGSGRLGLAIEAIGQAILRGELYK